MIALKKIVKEAVIRHHLNTVELPTELKEEVLSDYLIAFKPESPMYMATLSTFSYVKKNIVKIRTPPYTIVYRHDEHGITADPKDKADHRAKFFTHGKIKNFVFSPLYYVNDGAAATSDWYWHGNVRNTPYDDVIQTALSKLKLWTDNVEEQGMACFGLYPCYSTNACFFKRFFVISARKTLNWLHDHDTTIKAIAIDNKIYIKCIKNGSVEALMIPQMKNGITRFTRQWGDQPIIVLTPEFNWLFYRAQEEDEDLFDGEDEEVVGVYEDDEAVVPV